MVVSRLFRQYFILGLLVASPLSVAGRGKDGEPENNREPDESKDGGTKTGKVADESVGTSDKIEEETGSIVHDAVDWFKCLFLNDCGDTHKNVNDEPEEKEEQLKELDIFCGFKNHVFDCGCCTDHLISDPGKRANLMYGGGPFDEKHKFAPAFTRTRTGEEFAKGKVRAWSLGGHVTSVWCDRGKAICRCEDPTTLWHEEEPGCRPSDPCAPPDPPAEAVSFWSPLNRTGQISQKAQGDKPSCWGQEKEERVSIGAAKCEDMSVQQCNRLYAKGYEPGTWHFCKVDKHAVRTCGATTTCDPTTDTPKTPPCDNHAKHHSEAKLEVEQAHYWALSKAYTPDTNWSIHQEDNEIIRVDTDPLPNARQVRKKLMSVKPETYDENVMSETHAFHPRNTELSLAERLKTHALHVNAHHHHKHHRKHDL